MSTTCRWVSTTQPRVLPKRHEEDCERDSCTGCLPCPEAHCRVCAKEHAEGACPACMAEARDDLQQIGKLCPNLPAEVVHQGVDSEAMALLSPAANPEAWGHVTTSVKVGRLPVDYLTCDRCDNVWPCAKHADGEQHPLFVLGTWEMVWRDALDHETDVLVTIADAVTYLDAQLTYMAAYEHAPFEDFARDLRKCRAHLESVLHDGEQRDTGAPCMDCDVPQRQMWTGREMPWSSPEKTDKATTDGWVCPRCRKWSTEEQYRFAVAADHIEHAEWLTASDMEIRTQVKASTVRSWGRDAQPLPRKVRKQRDSERTLYAVADVIAQRDRVETTTKEIA